MESVNKIEYNVRELGTRSVTLFPSRAQICRDIKDINLKTGTNEITIFGLSPTVDEDSVKIEGTGAAVISDIAVELLPNRDIFEDVYPETDEESSASDDSDSDDLTDDEEPPELRDARTKLANLKDELTVAEEAVSSADWRVEILRTYGDTIKSTEETEVVDELATLKSEREGAHQDRMIALRDQRDLNDKILAASKVVAKLNRAQTKARAEAEKIKNKIMMAKAKEKAKKAVIDTERRKEKSRIREEREKFWPKNCYAVRVTIEASGYTPASSRRGSISSDTEVGVAPLSPTANKRGDATSDSAPTGCDLVLSYVTSSAYWLPRYDLQLSTTKVAGSLCFDAQLCNKTSESWTNCKISLSTSQANFSILDEKIPSLSPWHIQLASMPPPSGANTDITWSIKEFQVARQNARQREQTVHKPTAHMFGLDVSKTSRKRQEAEIMYNMNSLKKRKQAQQQQDIIQLQQRETSRGSGMVATVHPNCVAEPSRKQYGAKRHRRSGATRFMASGENDSTDSALEEDEEDEDYGFALDEEVDAGIVGGDIDIADMKLDFEESSVEETGLTTTYDLPGIKALIPKSGSSKQRVARVNLANVAFSHIVVAKYKPAAYLKARFKNNSRHSLLGGQAGLTLDGTFMGKTTLPRCSSGELFNLSLGIDPAIKVAYAKPDVRRTTTGMFNKEDSTVYVRSVNIENTRASSGKSAILVVHDQIPISQDEKLRVEILKPQGVSISGNAVNAGESTRDARAADKNWGSAKADLKDGGEITWQVNLNAGKAVKLGLEYTVAMPSGETAVEIQGN